MIELPPGRFSTTVGWPHFSESFCADSRVNGSRLPPGGNGVMKRTARVGYAVCAGAGTLRQTNTPNASARAADMTGSFTTSVRPGSIEPHIELAEEIPYQLVIRLHSLR